MGQIDWALGGDYLETCSCNYVCPCVASNLKDRPTHGWCKAALLFDVKKGHYVLVAAGVMSLAWMLLLTGLVFVEKVLPYGPRAASLIGLALVVLGLGVGSGAV
jgi:hypothetical protein